MAWTLWGGGGQGHANDSHCSGDTRQSAMLNGQGRRGGGKGASVASAMLTASTTFCWKDITASRAALSPPRLEERKR